jgi:hypothetical protein
MGLEIKPESLGYLRGIPEEVYKKWKVTEYRDSLETTVTMKGPELEKYKDHIKEAFFVWYHPNGYGSSLRMGVDKDGEVFIETKRYLNCD